LIPVTTLARWEALLGAITTFREASRLLDELAGVQWAAIP
jgi:hypothetical protein